MDELPLSELPEVVSLRDARGPRPENAAGAAEFWYEPEVWSLPVSPAAKVLYAGLCSYLGHGEIHRRDLRNTLKDSSDAGVAAALDELAGYGLLEPLGDGSPGYRPLVYRIRSVAELRG